MLLVKQCYERNSFYSASIHAGDRNKLHKFDKERRLGLLQFVTGAIPYEGFPAFRGSAGPRKVCIEKVWKNIQLVKVANTTRFKCHNMDI